MKTIIYTNSGDTYLGEHSEQKLSYWLHTAKVKNHKYLYKGYRFFNDIKDIVVVMSKKQWSKKEIKRRKTNGFLGIKEYRV